MAAKSVLVIEPSEQERKELVELLEKLGYLVDEAAASEDGLRKFAEIRHDLVIVEVLLSGLNGLKVCKMIKEQGQEWKVKTIVISKIYQSRAMQYDALNRYGADAYFAQPFPLVDLFNTIGELIGEAKPKGRVKMTAKEEPGFVEPAPKEPETPPPEPEIVSSVWKKEKPPTQKEQVSSETEPVADKGEFDPARLAWLLGRLAREKMSGLLVLTGKDETKHIYYVDGAIVFVQSTNREESLGRMLLADGVIDEEQYRSAMVEMAESGKKLGTVLTNMGFLNKDVLYYQLVTQTRRKVARCFAWLEGTYEIQQQAKYPEKAPTFDNEVTAVALEGYKNYLPAALLEEEYNRDKGKYLYLGDAKMIAMARQCLSEQEATLLEYGEGASTVSEVVGDSSLGLTDTLRVLQALVNAGALRLALVGKQPDLVAYGSEAPPETEPPEQDPQDQARYEEIKKFAVRMDDMNYFEILGLEIDAGEEDTKKAYLTQKKKFAAEGFGPMAPRRVRRMAESIVARLQEAYDALADPEDRQKYRRKLSEREIGGLGDKQAEEGEAESAEKPKESALKARIHFQDGLVAMEKRRYATATDFFRQAIAIDPTNVDYRAKLAKTMYKQLTEPPFTWQEVEEVAKQVLAIDKKRVDIMALMGRIKAKGNDDETALRYFRKAYELDPNNEQLKREIHYTEQRMKEEPKKKSVFGKLL